MTRVYGEAALEQFRNAVNGEAPAARLDDLHRVIAWVHSQLRLGARVDGVRTPTKPMCTLNVRLADRGSSLVTIVHSGAKPAIDLYPALRDAAPEAAGEIARVTGFTFARRKAVFRAFTHDELDLLSTAFDEYREALDDTSPLLHMRGLGPYRRPDPRRYKRSREPFLHDPNELDRATARHATLQNELAANVEDCGYLPQGPGPLADIDIAWWVGNLLVVAEVKTTSNRNESKQLRLGLGQLLDYVDALSVEADCVRGVLVTEREPPERWISLCGDHGIAVAWPPDFEGALGG